MALLDSKPATAKAALERYISAFEIDNDKELSLVRNIIDTNPELSLMLSPDVIDQVNAYTQALSKLANATKIKSGHLVSVTSQGEHFHSGRVNLVYPESELQTFSVCLQGDAVLSSPDVHQYGLRQSLTGARFCTYSFNDIISADTQTSEYLVQVNIGGSSRLLSLSIPMKRWIISSDQ